MEFPRFLVASTRRGEFSQWLPASRTPSYALPPRKEGFRFHLPTEHSAVVYGSRFTLSGASAPSVSSGKPCFSVHSPSSTKLQASRRFSLYCSAAVTPTKETAALFYRCCPPAGLSRARQHAHQYAALSTTSGANIPASPVPPPSAGRQRMDGPVRDEDSADEDSAYMRSKLDELVKNTAVVLFMKGSPEEPQCGFSARAVALLEASDIEDYTFINILKYPEIRSLAKKHFQWPTYPLLIVGGEVVGGVDIMEELNKTGELKQMMQSAIKKYTQAQSNIKT